MHFFSYSHCIIKFDKIIELFDSKGQKKIMLHCYKDNAWRGLVVVNESDLPLLTNPFPLPRKFQVGRYEVPDEITTTDAHLYTCKPAGVCAWQSVPFLSFSLTPFFFFFNISVSRLFFTNLKRDFVVNKTW